MSSTGVQDMEAIAPADAASDPADEPTSEESMQRGAHESAAQAEGISKRELTAMLEAILFVSAEPIPVARLVTVLGNVTKGEVQQALHLLADDMEQDGRGIQLAHIAGGYRLVTKQEYAPWVKRLDKAKSAQKLSRSALESLAIIAYKQPLVRAEIEEIRGVETSGVIRTLLERKLVRIVGRKEVPGRPIMYGTTKFFLEHFGLQDLTQLPPLREFKELGEAEQALLPIEETLSFPEGESAIDPTGVSALSGYVSEEGTTVEAALDTELDRETVEQG